MVKEYLCEKMNGSHKNSPKKKSWFGKLGKCSTFSGANIPLDDREGYIMQNYRSIEGLASPRYVGMFSPKRLLSPKSYFSRWITCCGFACIICKFVALCYRSVLVWHALCILKLYIKPHAAFRTPNFCIVNYNGSSTHAEMLG